MSSASVMSAVAARLAANWTHTPVIGPNIGGTVPADGSAFLALTFPVSDEAMISAGSPGSNVYREDGAFRLVLSVPVGLGLDPYLAWIDELRTLFRAATFDGVLTWEAPPAAIDDEADAGGYLRLSVAIPYQFDIFA